VAVPSWIVWPAFVALFLAVLALDLGVFHRKSAVLSIRQALSWTAFWVVVATAFTIVVYGLYEFNWFGWRAEPQDPSGADASLQYVTGFVLEWSLSVDNIFVMVLIFASMRIPQANQYPVLFWGIIGAITLRGAMIAVGSALIHTFSWMFYVFGAILLISAARLFWSDEPDPAGGVVGRFVRRLFPVSDQLDGNRFFTRITGVRTATPLFLALMLIDFADVIFAVDSIPAIFAVTQDPFLVFSSNAFALLGLRSLYFAVAGMMTLFEYVKFSLIGILGFVGVKMLLHQHYPISNLLSLGVIALCLCIGIAASLIRARSARALR
jgi:tellurite resistance protein TerC